MSEWKIGEHVGAIVYTGSRSASPDIVIKALGGTGEMPADLANRAVEKALERFPSMSPEDIDSVLLLREQQCEVRVKVKSAPRYTVEVL